MRLTDIRANLTLQQTQVAQLIVDNEFAGKQKRTFDEIAEDAGISVRTLFEWRQDRWFIQYQNYIADNTLDAFVPTAMAKLFEAIEGRSNNGAGSIKAIELFMKLNGRLVERRQIVTLDEDAQRERPSRDEIAKELEHLSKYLQ